MGKIRKHKVKKTPGTATKSLDSIALNKKKQKQFSKKTKLAKKIRRDIPTTKGLSHGVIRLTNIPHGFYERQCRDILDSLEKSWISKLQGAVRVQSHWVWHM
jgi:hypothetical protein